MEASAIRDKFCQERSLLLFASPPDIRLLVKTKNGGVKSVYFPCGFIQQRLKVVRKPTVHPYTCCPPNLHV